MSRVDEVSQDLADLLNALCEGELDPDDAARLERMICADPAACRLYFRYIDVHVELRRRYGYSQASNNEVYSHEGQSVADSVTPIRLPVVIPSSSVSDPQSIGSPLSSFLHGTVGWFSSGWPVAYLVATVIFGIGLVIGSLVPVSEPVQVARQSALPSTFGRGAGGEGSDNLSHSRPTVGRITGMVDCRWMENPKSEIRNPKEIGNHQSSISNQKSLVSLGDKFALSSGLLEITYDTGAKVILQGPMKYEVESASAGFLSVGKLTARVEGRGARDEGTPNLQISKSPNPSPLSPLPSPLFTIKTPTATVTDLGTEFGVEVSKEGDTISHVFCGSVQFQPATVAGEAAGQPIILRENESAQLKLGADRKFLVSRLPVKYQGFVRQMPNMPARLLLGDTFENQANSNAYGEDGGYGLNECLPRRQFGLFRPTVYVRGGDCVEFPSLAQVAHPACHGKLNLFTEPGNAGWVVLNRYFPRDLVVSAELNPDAVRCADRSHVPKTLSADPASKNWMALGVRGSSLWLDHKELPLASNGGAVFRVRYNGEWDCFENGVPIANGRVSPTCPYRIVMRVLGDQWEISVNGVVLNLDPIGSRTARTLHGQAAETKENCISLGAGAVPIAATPTGSTVIDINSVGNLTIVEARPGAFAAIKMPSLPAPDAEPPRK